MCFIGAPFYQICTADGTASGLWKGTTERCPGIKTIQSLNASLPTSDEIHGLAALRCQRHRAADSRSSIRDAHAYRLKEGLRQKLPVEYHLRFNHDAFPILLARSRKMFIRLVVATFLFLICVADTTAQAQVTRPGPAGPSPILPPLLRAALLHSGIAAVFVEGNMVSVFSEHSL